MGNTLLVCISKEDSKGNLVRQQSGNRYSEEEKVLQNIYRHGIPIVRKNSKNLAGKSFVSSVTTLPPLPNREKIRKISRKMSGKDHRESYTPPRLSSESKTFQSGSDEDTIDKGKQREDQEQQTQDMLQSEYHGELRYVMIQAFAQT